MGLELELWLWACGEHLKMEHLHTYRVARMEI